MFGKIRDGNLVLTQFGKVAKEEWIKSSVVRTEIELNENEFVVMPNHIHGIVWINNLTSVGRRELKLVTSRPRVI